MSVEAMNAAYKTQTGSPTRKAVLVALANQADQDGRCWPSISYLVNRTELGRRTVIAAIADLEKSGIIEKVIRPGDGSGRESNVYLLHFGQSAALAPGKVQQPHKGQSAAHAGQSATDAGKVQLSHPNNHLTITKQSVKEFAESHNAGDECDDWMTVLKKKKAATTEAAWSRRLNKMKKLVAEGHSLKAILERSADSGWTGLFPPKESKSTFVPEDREGIVALAEKHHIDIPGDWTLWQARNHLADKLGMRK